MRGRCLCLPCLLLTVSATLSLTPLLTARRMPATCRRTPDDLGFADTQMNNPFSPTPHIGELAYSGVKLLQYHAYMYCSPTRRSILSGRFPIHLGTEQAPVCSNFLPLQMTLLPAKLKQAGYTGHFIGKGHLGYQTTDQCVVIPCAAALPRDYSRSLAGGGMPDSPARQSARQSLMPCSARTTVLARSLPINRGFASHLGYLEASEHYYHGMQEGCDIPQYAGLPVGSQHTPQNPGPRHGQWPPPGGPGAAPRAWQCHFDMWRNHTTATAAELAALSYDTNAYAQHTISHIKRAAPAERLYVHLMWHAVHAPYTPAPLTETIEPTAAGYYANYCPPPGRNGNEKLCCKMRC